jgi:hypothetical protein
MATKTKNNKIINNLSQTIKATGVVMMAAAVTLGLVELPQEEEKRRAVVPARAVFAFAGETNNDQGGSTLRREREESGPHYISYGVTQRSPSRTGRL